MPNLYGHLKRPRVSQANSWQDSQKGIQSFFWNWADAVKRELVAPDLWLEATKAVQLFESVAEPSADKFTIAELGALHGQLRMLGQLFENSELLQDHRSELAELIQTAAVKAETFTKQRLAKLDKGSLYQCCCFA